VALSITDLTGTAGHDDLVGTSSSASGSGRLKRRTFTAEYKPAILEEYDQADSQGRGALLRRERLMTSHISEWRKARKGGALKALEPKTRKPAKSTVQAEVDKLRIEKEKLATTKAALEIAGKAHALLEMLSESADSDNEHKK
jgi:transposase